MKKITFIIALLTVSMSFGQTNLFVNGGFETGVTTGPGWQQGETGYSYITEAVQLNSLVGASYVVDVAPRTGTYCGVKRSGSSAFQQAVDVTPGKTYIVNFWFYNSFNTNAINAKIKDFTGNVTTLPFLALTPLVPDTGANAADAKNYGTRQPDGRVWKEAKFSFTVPEGVTRVRFAYWSNDTGFNFMDDASMVEDTTASIDDLKKFNFSAYPNPASNNLTVSASKNIENVEIFNLIGQKLLSLTPNTNNKTIDVSNLNTGVYILKATIEGIKGSYKFVKQ